MSARIRNDTLLVTPEQFAWMQEELANPFRTPDQNAYAAMVVAGVPDREITMQHWRETKVVVV